MLNVWLFLAAYLTLAGVAVAIGELCAGVDDCLGSDCCKFGVCTDSFSGNACEDGMCNSDFECPFAIIDGFDFYEYTCTYGVCTKSDADIHGAMSLTIGLSIGGFVLFFVVVPIVLCFCFGVACFRGRRQQPRYARGVVVSNISSYAAQPEPSSSYQASALYQQQQPAYPYTPTNQQPPPPVYQEQPPQYTPSAP